MDTYNPPSYAERKKLFDELKEIVRRYDIPIITAVQAQPHRRCGFHVRCVTFVIDHLSLVGEP